MSSLIVNVLLVLVENVSELIDLVKSTHNHLDPCSSKLIGVTLEEVLHQGLYSRLYHFLKSEDHYVRHLLILSILEDPDDVLISTWRVSSNVEANDLDSDFLRLLDQLLLLILDLLVNEHLHGFVLREGIEALQDQDTFLLKIVGQGLLFPPLQADHLVLDLVECSLVSLQCHLSHDRFRPRVLFGDKIARHCPQINESFVPFFGRLHARYHTYQGLQTDHLLGYVGSIEAIDTIGSNHTTLQPFNVLNQLSHHRGTIW